MPNLEPGNYVIFLQVSWDIFIHKNRQIAVGIRSSKNNISSLDQIHPEISIKSSL